jgi:copper homeostasis protein
MHWNRRRAILRNLSPITAGEPTIVNLPPSHRVLLEVCVGSLADARAAADAGAGRLELCSALELGGLTPSLALVEQVVGEVDLPVVVMLRPRCGGFCYSDDEARGMLRDAELALAAGASGLAFGFLETSGLIDVPRTNKLVELAGGKQTVFHRAFDFVPNLAAALDVLIDLGVTRVLTTGGATSAIEGAESLRQLIDRAMDRIEILPGGGISAVHVVQLVAASGCKQIHVGAATSDDDKSIAADEAARFCDLPRLSTGQQRVVDGRTVADIAQQLLRMAT